jgi:hypothetical protein
MTDWTPAIDGDGELRVAAQRPDGTLRTPRIVWHVVVDGACTSAPFAGRRAPGTAAWSAPAPARSTLAGVHAEVTFTHDDAHDDAIDRAYHAKYGRGPACTALGSWLGCGRRIARRARGA